MSPMNGIEEIRPWAARSPHASWCLGLLLAVLLPGAAAGVPLVIFDTDYRSDCDDVGALATLHALQDLGRATTIGGVATTTGPHVVAAMDAVNTYYGRPDIPIGLTIPGGPSPTPGSDDYAPVLANTRAFVSTQTNTNAPESTALYRQLLHAAPTNSVAIVVVGGQTAIHRLLQSGANHAGDGIGLTGPELIASRVRELVIMGGHFTDPNFAEYNIKLDIPAAQQIARTWPSPIVYSGYEIGLPIRTGAALSGPVTNPVAAAYQAFRGTTGGAGVIGNRQSWDQTAVLYAVEGVTCEGQTVWQRSAPHHIDFTDAGRTLKTNAPGANRFFLIEAMAPTNVAVIISGLMTRPPDNPGPRPAPLGAAVGVRADWPFDQNGGGTVEDRSGGGHAAELRNFSSTAPGAGNSSGSGWTSDGWLRFDGTDDFVETALSLSDLGDDSFTFEAVFRYSGGAGRTWTPLLGSSHSPYAASEILFIGKAQNNDSLHVSLGGLATFSIPGEGSFDGQEHHLAVVFDRTNAELRMFKDGALIHTRGDAGPVFSATSRLLIGATGHAAGERWLGSIRAVRVTRQVLQPSQFIPAPRTRVIRATGGEHGSIQPAGNILVPEGSTPHFLLTPAPYHQVADVTTNGVSVGAVTAFTWTAVTADGVIEAAFAPRLAAGGTPHSWLAYYGLTEGGLSFDEAEAADPDEDGFTSGQEYIAKTNPTNASSFFQITGFASDGSFMLSFEGSSHRLYAMQWADDPAEGKWDPVPGQGPCQGAGGLDLMVDSNTMSQRFYRLEVQLP
jgi:inosine-uridine nucleoside N-ribohydrolase